MNQQAEISNMDGKTENERNARALSEFYASLPKLIISENFETETGDKS